MIENIWNGFINMISSIGLNWIVSWYDLAPLAVGVGLQLIIVLLLILIFLFAKRSKFGLMFELMVENVYEFFEEILEEKGKRWIKIFVVTLFFIILLSNLSGWILDFVRSALEMTDIAVWNSMSNYIEIPTATIEFNVALAIVSIILMLYAQIKHLGVLKFFLEYLPITGKGILDISKEDVENPWIYRPAKIVIKAFDIAISLFVWILDIVGVLAKVISLSARLYGNMIAGGILLGFLVVGINNAMTGLVWGSFAVIAPLILFLQGLLVAVIQAFVFPLLVGIFMKLAQSDSE